MFRLIVCFKLQTHIGRSEHNLVYLTQRWAIFLLTLWQPELIFNKVWGIFFSAVFVVSHGISKPKHWDTL